MKKYIIFFVMFFFLTIINCILSSDSASSGIFKAVAGIELSLPLDESTLTSVDPIFIWEKIKKNNDDKIHEIIILFNNTIQVDGNKITNKADAWWMWDSNLPNGVPGNVEFSDGKMVTYDAVNDRILYDPSEPSPSLVSSTTYYWVVIAYSYDGEVLRASIDYQFTYN